MLSGVDCDVFGKVSKLGRAAADAVARALDGEDWDPFHMSCDEGEGHKVDAMLHCGLCTSCLFRRISLHATGLPDRTSYRDVATRRHGIYEVNAFENHAAQLLACRSFDDLLDLDPDARFATEFPFSNSSNELPSGAEVFAMYQRYATEIRLYFESARPTVAKRLPQIRKDNERDLFSATG
jgi:hypothetical protein